MKTRARTQVLPLLVLPFAFLSAEVNAGGKVCESNLPTQRWTECFALYQLSTGDTYYGYFLAGRFHGVGRYATKEGPIFVGEFNAGRRQGRGVEYNRNGEVIRLGRWDGSFVEWTSVTPSSFPFSGDLPKLVNDRDARVSTGFGSELELSKAYERIAILEAELRELRKNASNTGASRAVPLPRTENDLVKACISRGLRPGSAGFSRCLTE